MKKSKILYRKLVEKADDIGADNPMAYNELFALAFVAPYLASEKKIPPETLQLMMERSLYYVKWYFSRTDLNTDKGKNVNKKILSNILGGIPPKRRRSTPRHSRSILRGSLMKTPAITVSQDVLFVHTARRSERRKSCLICASLTMS